MMVVQPRRFAPLVTDPLFASVALLVQPMAGDSSVFDRSPAGRAFTTAGAAIDGEAFLPGGASVGLTGSGSRLALASANAFDVTASNDLTVEILFKPASLVETCIFGRDLNDNGAWGQAPSEFYIVLNANGSWKFAVGSTEVTGSGSYAANTWNYLCLGKSGSTVKHGCGTGSSVALTTTSPSYQNSVTTGTVYIGEGHNIADFGGKIAALRYTMAQRFTGTTATTPTALFPTA